MTVIDSIIRIHFLDLLLGFLKLKEKFVNLHQMLHLVTDGFLIYGTSGEVSSNIFVLFLHISQPYFQ